MMQGILLVSEVLVCGAGGHACAVISLLQQLQIKVISVIDRPRCENENIFGIQIQPYFTDNILPIVIAVGNNESRQKKWLQWESRLYLENISHYSAIVDNSALLGVGNQLFAGCFIGPKSQLGSCNIINTHAVVEHEAYIGNFNHLSVGSKVLGRSKVGDRCFIGAGAVIRDGVCIGNDITLGVNSYVNKDIFEAGVYVGIPAKRIK